MSGNQGGNGDGNPPPPNWEQTMLQMQQQMEGMRTIINAQEALRAREQGPPVRNQFANVNIPGPAFGPRIEAHNFELKTGLLQMVQQNPFAGRATENPHKHITRFLGIASTVKQNGVSEDTIKMRLFPFSLIDAAQDWFESLEPGSIRSWDDLVEKFLAKFFPLSTTLRLQAEISQFRMRDQETMGEAWDRFKSLLKQCPNHGITPGHQVSIFYNGCTDFIKSQLDFSSDGSFLDQPIEKCTSKLEKLACNSRGWSSGRDGSLRVAATVDNDAITLLSQQMLMMNQKIDELKGPQEVVEDVNYLHQPSGSKNYNNYRSNQGSGFYNPNRPHPNLSYGNPNNAQQPPPGFNASKGVGEDASHASTNELLKALLAQNETMWAKSNERHDKVETAVVEINARIDTLETQMSQIAQAVGRQHQQGQFPSQPIPNPKECKAINVINDTVHDPPSLVQGEESKHDKPVKAVCTSDMPNIPFPSRIKELKIDEDSTKFLNIFRKLRINLPLVEDLQLRPTYLQALKNVFSKKKKWSEYEEIALPESCNAILQRKLPAKLKDPGSFTISCVIGDDRQTKALCDLGASINLMPLSFFQKLKFGTLKPTSMTLQMADGSIKHPNGIIEDVLVKVNDFIFPVDFVVLDMQANLEVPLILGRPFLATGKAMIDMSRGELTLQMGKKKHILSIYNAMKSPKEGNLVMQRKCKTVNVVAKIEVRKEEKPVVDLRGEVVEKKRKQVLADELRGKPPILKPKESWWKKRLAKLFLAERKKNKDVNSIIRVRIS